jgi:hypothetical protein
MSVCQDGILATPIYRLRLSQCRQRQSGRTTVNPCADPIQISESLPHHRQRKIMCPEPPGPAILRVCIPRSFANFTVAAAARVDPVTWRASIRMLGFFSNPYRFRVKRGPPFSAAQFRIASVGILVRPHQAAPPPCPRYPHTVNDCGGMQGLADGSEIVVHHQNGGCDLF